MGSKRNKQKKTASPSSQPTVADTPPDDDLVDDLLAQLDARDARVQQETATVVQDIVTSNANGNNNLIDDNKTKEKKDPKSRWRARQAKKAQALIDTQKPTDKDADARTEREIRNEEKTIKKILDELDVEMYEINPDGHCLYSAVADQLALLGILSETSATYATTRAAAAGHMLSHPDDFRPFLPSADDSGAADGLMGAEEYTRYCAAIRDTGVWGGEPEILALSRAYAIPIHVVQSGTPSIVVHDPSGEGKADKLKHVRAARISYHRYMYGLGEHYNSLRPREHGLHRLTSPLKNLLS